MEELKKFISKVIANTEPFDGEMTVEKARNIITEINNFLYTTYDNIGVDYKLDQEFQYFSEFHKFWKNHHKEILDIRIDNDACEKVADALHEVYLKTNGAAFKEIYDTHGLKNEEICRVRFLTANQDFNGSREFSKLASIFRDDASIFDEKIIFDDPEDFIKNIGITSLSQNDKRVQYAKTISLFLLNKKISPFKILEYYDRDVSKLRNEIINLQGSGYGNKKADMFIRDMVVLGVWENVKGFEQIDVASDVNKIKVALRTGIMKPAIPLISSFLDIFCYQYAYVDEQNALAWRRVWEIWSKKYPYEKISSPCLLDYFIYNVVGKQFCKESLYIYKCETDKHCFKWHSHNIKNCQICYKNGIKNKAFIISRKMPCLDEEGKIAIKNTPFYMSNLAKPNFDVCPFKDICLQENKHKLNPPKSISILGRTGWTTAYADKESGGGGLMA